MEGLLVTTRLLSLGLCFLTLKVCRDKVGISERIGLFLSQLLFELHELESLAPDFLVEAVVVRVSLLGLFCFLRHYSLRLRVL